MARKGAKRQRVGSPVDEHRAIVPAKHKRFMTWAKQQGVETHGIQPQQIEGRGLGLVTTRPIKTGDRILFIPEDALFKPDFTVLRQLNLERASSQAKTALSALLHFAPADSPANLWLDTWPNRSDFRTCMPIYWNAVVHERLPTATRAVLDRQLADYNRDWAACQKAINRNGYTEDDFRYYWMIVNSRSFHWAPPSGGAGYMVLCPFVDYTNHGPTGTGCDVRQRSDGYEVLAQRDYKPGEEILFSYGAHSNDKLLVHYGFLLIAPRRGNICFDDMGLGSIDDEIRIDDALLPNIDDSVKQQLSDVGFLGPFAIVPKTTGDNKYNGCEPCFKTQVAIRATMLTCNEWEYFATHGEDLAGDHSFAVNEKLLHMVGPWCVEAEKQTGHIPEDDVPAGMTQQDYHDACTTARKRWDQSLRCLSWFEQHHEAEAAT